MRFRFLSIAVAVSAAASGQQLLPPTTLLDACQGAYYVSTVGVNGYSPYHSVLMAGSNLPQGLIFEDNPDFGPQIRGIPQAFGQFSFTVQVTDSSPAPMTETRQYSLLVHDGGSPPLVFTTDTLPDAIYGGRYGPQILVSGGKCPAHASFSGVNTFSQDLNGSMIAVAITDPPGTYKLPVTATDSSIPPQTLQKTVTLIIRPGLLLEQTFPDARVFVPYSAQIYVNGGGTAPYAFAMASGVLPHGLQMNRNTGAISGTPTHTGTYSFGVAVTDSVGVSGTQDFFIRVNSAELTVAAYHGTSRVDLSFGNLPVGRYGVPYDPITFTISGGVPPYVWTQIAGVPAGMSFSSAGVLSGTPLGRGNGCLTFLAFDQAGNVAGANLGIAIQDLAPIELSDGVTGQSYTEQLVGISFSNHWTLSLASGALPPGLTIMHSTLSSVDQFIDLYELSGKPTQTGLFSFVLAATDQGQTPVTRAYMMSVGSPDRPCTFSVAGSPGTVGIGGGTGSVTITAPAGCAWTAVSDSTWLTPLLAPGTGTATLTWTAAPNPGPKPRTGMFTAQHYVFQVTQPGAAAKLAIRLSHSGDFVPGQNGAVYKIAVSNDAAGLPTSGAVTVSDIPFNGITFVSMAGPGWSCLINNCTRSDSLAPGASYPDITVTVNVATGSLTLALNTAAVSGGGSATATASDSTTVTQPPGCAFWLTPPDPTLSAAGTSTGGFWPSISLTFTVTPSADCQGLTWTATSSDTSWLTVSYGASGIAHGTAPATVSYIAFSNPHSSTRTGTITVSAPGVTPATFTVTEAASTLPLVDRQIVALYQQILGREPDSGGFTFWSGLGAFGLGPMADQFLNSPENRDTGFQAMAIYQGLLGRIPTYSEFMTASASIRTGSTQTPAQLFASVLNGSEYVGLYGSPTEYTNFVSHLYQNLLGRSPTAAESSAAVTALGNASQTPYGLFSALYTGPEFQNNGQYHTGPDHSNGLYVKMLYFLILARDLDSGGFTFWKGIADGGGPGIYYAGSAAYPTRILMLGTGDPNEGFIGSPEFQGRFQ